MVATILDSCGFHFCALVYSSEDWYDIMDRGSGKSNDDRELNDRDDDLMSGGEDNDI